jgi:hypothetical protein
MKTHSHEAAFPQYHHDLGHNEARTRELILYISQHEFGLTRLNKLPVERRFRRLCLDWARHHRGGVPARPVWARSSPNEAATNQDAEGRRGRRGLPQIA